MTYGATTVQGTPNDLDQFDRQRSLLSYLYVPLFVHPTLCWPASASDTCAPLFETSLTLSVILWKDAWKVLVRKQLFGSLWSCYICRPTQQSRTVFCLCSEKNGGAVYSSWWIAKWTYNRQWQYWFIHMTVLFFSDYYAQGYLWRNGSELFQMVFSGFFLYKYTWKTLTKSAFTLNGDRGKWKFIYYEFSTVNFEVIHCLKIE